MANREEVTQFMRGLQDAICAGLESLDGRTAFREDSWELHSGGGGRSRVLVHGGVFEKAGVNFSAVSGKLPAFLGSHVSPDASQFFATGVSIVLHPYSPLVPIVHANVRYFESDAGDCWFGGGIDLTPVYVVEEHARHFHRTLRGVCDGFDPGWYERFRDAADDYFFIPHRNETRGIGGIFFDYLKPGPDKDFYTLFAFTRAVGEAFLPSYVPIAREQAELPWNERQKQWQLVRRGRYVEFNLVYDKGTRFGLETGGRIESILMSLPEHASWIYGFRPEPGSEEEKSLHLFRKGIRWA